MTTYQDPVDIDSDGAEQQFAVITDDALDSLRRLIGVPIADTVEPWCYEVTRDNIRHYAHGIGDDNPLWCDPAYAAGTRVRHDSSPRRASCSPSTASCRATSAACPASTPCGPAPTSPGTARCRSGTEVRTEAHLKDLVEHQTRFAGRAFQQIYHVEFSDPDGNLAGQRRLLVLPHRARHRPGARHQVRRGQGPPARCATPRPTAEEIFDLYEAEEVRGAEPRYLRGRRGRRRAAPDGQGPDDRHRLHRLRPGLGRPLHPGQQAGLQAAARSTRASASPTPSASPTCPERVHWENDLATDVGTPGAYDYGPERCSWLTHHLTNWMGDDGFLRQHQTPDPPPQRRRGLDPHHRPGHRQGHRRRGPRRSSRSSRRPATSTATCRPSGPERSSSRTRT